MDQRISISELTIGMYVSSLDREWIDTPFLLEGFHIESKKEINTLERYCSFVYIDPRRGLAFAKNTATNNKLEKYGSKIHHYIERFLQGGKKETEYVTSAPVKEELPKAKEAIKAATKSIINIVQNIKTGKEIKIESIEGIVDPILSSVIRNPEAYMWLSMMKGSSDYSYTHSIDNCSLAVVFGRHLGIPKKELKTLAVGLLMMDAGKVLISNEVLNKTGQLSEKEYKSMLNHVEYGVDILSKIKGFPKEAIDITLTHHERFDGDGYPSGLSGTDIPVYGRIAAIIDCYNAMTNYRPYKPAKSASVALQEMYNLRGKAFQPEMIEQFLQCFGAYPTGSIIEMTNDEVGIVVSQNLTQRMRPKIMLLLDKNKKHFSEYQIIDLTKVYEDSNGEPLYIRRGLNPGDCGIDPTKYYL